MARIVAEKMRPALGQNIVIDNRGGADGIVGTDMVSNAAPDGHTLVVSLSTSLRINKFLFKNCRTSRRTARRRTWRWCRRSHGRPSCRS
jgi:tripartite-type tricarboxylate transporter receptor subunit TctC